MLQYEITSQWDLGGDGKCFWGWAPEEEWFRISLMTDNPDAEILGHCELEGVHKACPCFSCQEYRDYFKKPLN